MSRSGDRTSTFDPSHSDNLLHGLNLLWRKQLFCDVTLTAQGQQFHCHKAVLASCSQYFRSLFSSHPPLGGGVAGGQDGLGPPKDQQPPQQQQPPPPQEEPGTPSSSPDDKLLTSPRAINNLVLQGCSAIGLRLVLEYLYTANVTLSLDTVEEVLSVSKILHIPQVTKLCVQFLNDQISVQNYKQVCKIAALHGLEETKKLANKYLVEDVLLLNFEEMRALLDSLPPPVESELALFQMSVLWLEHDRETRMQYAPDLMKRLRFALIPAPELVERVQSVDFMRTDPVCQKLLLDAMNYHLMPFRQHCRQSLASRRKVEEPELAADLRNKGTFMTLGRFSKPMPMAVPLPRGESLLFLISYIRCRTSFAAVRRASGVRVWLSAPTAPASGLVPLKTDEASEMERRTKRERPRLEKKRVLENVEASLKDAEGQMCLRVCVRSPRHCVLTPQNQAHRNILGKWKGLEEGMENLCSYLKGDAKVFLVRISRKQHSPEFSVTADIQLSASLYIYMSITRQRRLQATILDLSAKQDLMIEKDSVKDWLIVNLWYLKRLLNNKRKYQNSKDGFSNECFKEMEIFNMLKRRHTATICHYRRIRSNKKMLLLVGGLPPGPDRLPSNLVQYYDDEKKTWKILTKTLYKGSTNNKKLNRVEKSSGVGDIKKKTIGHSTSETSCEQLSNYSVSTSVWQNIILGPLLTLNTLPAARHLDKAEHPVKTAEGCNGWGEIEDRASIPDGAKAQ
eukprot:bmy_21227T0